MVISVKFLQDGCYGCRAFKYLLSCTFETVGKVNCSKSTINSPLMYKRQCKEIKDYSKEITQVEHCRRSKQECLRWTIIQTKKKASRIFKTFLTSKCKSSSDLLLVKTVTTGPQVFVATVCSIKVAGLDKYQSRNMCFYVSRDEDLWDRRFCGRGNTGGWNYLQRSKTGKGRETKILNTSKLELSFANYMKKISHIFGVFD